MCGIVGGLGKNSWPMAEMIGAIAHRGPDRQSSFTEDSVFLGHARLSILDLSEQGNQPMVSEDGRYVIIFNGEIYNHLELRIELKSQEYHSTSDTETILVAYQQWGLDFLPRLNGIFALAIYDRIDKTVLLARDRFGVKPLYISESESQVVFASEIKAMLPVIEDCGVDEKAIFNYLTFLWSPGNQTPIQQVNKLLPGHCVKYSLEKGKLKREEKKFYQIPFIGKYFNSTEKELIDACENKLVQAVERQLLSDVPVGFFLSGGLDSSLLVAIAKRLRPAQQLDCFTIDTGDEISAEGFVPDLNYAKQVAQTLDVRLHIVKADIDIVRDFDGMIWHLDEPQADAAPLNVSNICKVALKNGFKVLIGGTAGDDVFSGYRRHQALLLEKYLQWIPPFLGRSFLALPLDQKQPLFRRLTKVLKESSLPQRDRLANYFRWLPHEVVNGLFTEQQQLELVGYQPTRYLFDRLKDIPDETSWLNKMLYWEMTSFLPDHNLNYTDKMAMAHGVEVRVPYLDNELVEFACQIPPHLKMKGRETKYILKKVAERYLPKEVIYRPKTGFGAPVRKWITSDMKQMIAERLSSPRLKEINLFNPEAVQRLISENERGEIDASYSIWCLLAIESWFRQFIEHKSESHFETAHTKS